MDVSGCGERKTREFIDTEERLELKEVYTKRGRGLGGGWKGGEERERKVSRF